MVTLAVLSSNFIAIAITGPLGSGAFDLMLAIAVGLAPTVLYQAKASVTPRSSSVG